MFAFPHDVTGGFLLSAWNTAVGIWQYAPLNYILQGIVSGPEAAWAAYDRQMQQTALGILAATRDPGGTAIAIGKDLLAWGMWATNPGGALGSVGFNAASLAIPGGAGIAIKGSNVVTRVTTTATRLCSFSAATGVLLADGTTRPIADIEVGDEVLAADPVTGEQAAEEVTNLWVHDDDLIDLATSAGVVTTTEDHPFWNHTDQQWQPAEELDTGDQLGTADGGAVTVVGLDEDSVQEGLAYNLTVERLHTYYVQIGGTPALVHNTNSCQVPWVTNGLPKQEAGALNDTLHHLDAGTVPDGPTSVKWGTPFENREGNLPPGSYSEYRVAPPAGSTNAGTNRVVVDNETGATYYTWTHYGTAGDPPFVRVR